jgi:cyclic-di-GMP-binding protein
VSVSDRASCNQWLSQARLGDPLAACEALAGLIEALEAPPEDAAARREILECLAGAVRNAYQAIGLKLAGGASPLSARDAAAFDACCRMSAAFARAWHGVARLPARASGPAGNLGAERARLFQHAAEGLLDVMLVHYQARREIDPAWWGELHALYREAEPLQWGATPLPDGSEPPPPCAPAYVTALMLSLSDPYCMSQRSIAWTCQLLRRWSSKIVLVEEPGPRDRIAVDLSGSSPPQLLGKSAGAQAQLRYLDLSALRRSVARRIHALKAGESPQALGLGDEGSREDMLEMLQGLERRWFMAPVVRHFKRRPAQSTTQLITTVGAIHALLAGTTQAPPRHSWETVHMEALLFKAADERRTAVVLPEPETWKLSEDSAMGFRLSSRATAARLHLHQLCATRPAGGSAFLLGEIRWLTGTAAGDVRIGVHTLPGLPVAVWARAVRTQVEEAFRHAFWLPASGSEERSLILPTGAFRIGELLEVRNQKGTQRLKIRDFLYRGYDFVRASVRAPEEAA